MLEEKLKYLGRRHFGMKNRPCGNECVYKHLADAPSRKIHLNYIYYSVVASLMSDTYFFGRLTSACGPFGKVGWRYRRGCLPGGVLRCVAADRVRSVGVCRRRFGVPGRLDLFTRAGRRRCH